MKDKTPFEKQHNLPYRAVCGTDNCTEDYVGETARCIVERATYHNGQDQHSDFVKRAIENNHLPVVKDDFTKLEGGYRNNTHKRKIAETLMIKVIRLSLNTKEKSVELKLFNGLSTLHKNVCSRTRSIAFIRHGNYPNLTTEIRQLCFSSCLGVIAYFFKCS